LLCLTRESAHEVRRELGIEAMKKDIKKMIKEGLREAIKEGKSSKGTLGTWAFMAVLLTYLGSIDGDIGALRTETNDNIQRLEGKIDAVRKENSADIAKLDAKFGEMQTDLTVLRSDVNHLTEKVNKMEQTLVDVRSDITDIRIDITDIRGDLNGLRKDLNGHLNGHSHIPEKTAALSPGKAGEIQEQVVSKVFISAPWCGDVCVVERITLTNNPALPLIVRQVDPEPFVLAGTRPVLLTVMALVGNPVAPVAS